MIIYKYIAYIMKISTKNIDFHEKHMYSEYYASNVFDW